ncbi:MAG: methylated-DNA--[protein]-cysteine S-methyltransferase [Anaerolineae bacterium]
MQRDYLYTLWHSPFGWIGLAASECGMLAITSPRASRRVARTALVETMGNAGRSGENAPIRATRRELLRYFKGDAGADLESIPLDMERGTPFQRRVWEELRKIPYGETRTYGELARTVGHPNAARAVGQCNARNPWAIVVPCHRLLGANAGLTGYAGGLEMKRRLLELERISGTASHAMGLAAAPQRRDIHAHRN